MDSSNSTGFLANLRYDLSRLWDCRSLVIKPFLFTLVLLAVIFILKQFTPWFFMDLGNKDEAFGSSVIVVISLLHGILLTNVFSVIWTQNDNISQALRYGDFKLFRDNFTRRIPVQMKMLIFALSVFIVYCIACFNFGSNKNNAIAISITLFVIILAWMAAYEMDDPFSGVWNIYKRVPKKWWKDLECDIEGSYENGRVRLRNVFDNGGDISDIEEQLIECGDSQKIVEQREGTERS